MHHPRLLNDAQFKEAQETPLVVRQTLKDNTAHAEFIAEMVRLAMVEAYGEESYTRGLTVHTTIRKADQDAAYAAVRRGAFEYDRRSGYGGHAGFISLPSDPAELEDAL